MILENEFYGVKIITPQIFSDERGYFTEVYRETNLLDISNGERFVQENQSRSKQGVIRGLHYQTRRPQGKLLRVVRGAILDVIVDLRLTSETFGRHFSVRLDDESQKQLFVPKGFAHGFSVLSESADVVYKCTDYYDPGFEETLLWDDKDLDIDWKVMKPIVSNKDKDGLSFEEVFKKLKRSRTT